jgi:hypothetical protein
MNMKGEKNKGVKLKKKNSKTILNKNKIKRMEIKSNKLRN